MTYITEIIVILLGVVLTLMGMKRKNKLLVGIGIGSLSASIILGIPDFIVGFQGGFKI